ncbi:hypothetical protein BDZ45DRAFT_721524 [Acephala macrosclerotiorum]|nr:hypothetical protein BDZ45DRAFT_721524 [Acephala macrosclerotiorum]
MPFYEIIHNITLSTEKREALATGITNLHSKAFNAPSHFVDIKFSHTGTGSILSQSSPAVPSYFVAGKARPHPNIIFAHVREGSTRSNEHFAKLAEGIESIWYEVLGLSYQPSGHPSHTHPPQANVGETVAHSGAPNGEKAFDWSDEKRLEAVFIVPGLIARESGLAVPEAG